MTLQFSLSYSTLRSLLSLHFAGSAEITRRGMVVLRVCVGFIFSLPNHCMQFSTRARAMAAGAASSRLWLREGG